MAKSGKNGSKRITKTELVGLLVNLFQSKGTEVVPLKDIYRILHLNTHPAKILCMDGLALEPGSFLDVGAPVGPALPVVIKTLVLSGGNT